MIQGKTFMSDMTRRRILAGLGTTGVAGAIATTNTQGNTQKPISANTNTNFKGRFTDKVVLITGATSGIGEATARAFAQEGAIVHFCGRREKLGEKVAQSINAAGGRASYQRADVRQEQDVASFIDTCISKYGRINVAFNNAGIESKPATIADRTLADWMDVMMTNATGIFCL